MSVEVLAAIVVAIPFLAAIALGAVLIDLCRMLEHTPRHAADEDTSPAVRERL
jgi:hypothetical protein